MPQKPNILFLFADQMQGKALEPDSPCITPNIDRLITNGTRFSRSYTACAITSPSQASLMTGLLPHNHGMLWVRHNVDDDQGCFREENPQWAQRLADAGYRTGFFTRWMVERTEELERFGWGEYVLPKSDAYKERAKMLRGDNPVEQKYSLERYYDAPPGYKQGIFYGVHNVPPEARGMGVAASLAEDFLQNAVQGPEPWCCFYSISEPHDPFITGQEAFDQYDVDSIPLRPNIHDDLDGRPNIYKKAALVWKDMTDREVREAAACYYASITEIDQMYGRLIKAVEDAGQLGNTIVIVSSDHGELLGAHGLYCKNLTAAQEVYHIPLVFCGPGIAKGKVSDALVGLHDVCPTLLELTGAEAFESADSKSFGSVLADPDGESGKFTQGFAEYFGGRYMLTQRILWDGPWKFALNGFDFDELYNLEDDPYEMKNLARDPAHQDRVRHMMKEIWRRIRDTGDHSLFNSHYPILRLAPYGPDILEEE